MLSPYLMHLQALQRSDALDRFAAQLTRDAEWCDHLRESRLAWLFRRSALRAKARALITYDRSRYGQ